MRAMIAAAATALAAATAQAEAPRAVWNDPTTDMPFVRIDKACYKMGSATPVKAFPDPFWERIGFKPTLSEDEVPHHEVCLNAYWIGKYEVRWSDWKKIMGEGEGEDDRPVTNITWEQARTFAERLSERSGSRFRLPTEAEWEHACRAGASTDQVVSGREPVGKAWHSQGEARRPAAEKVGQLAANAFGLHDMLGNVWEWTEDSYAADGYRRHALYNPIVRDPAAAQRVIRGAGFRTEPLQTRCTVRGHVAPFQALDSIGFRLVRLAGDKETKK